MTAFEAPIALFVYNRPEHMRRTLEALQRNRGSDQSRLFIFSDGLRKEACAAEQRLVEEVRCLIREKAWCSEVEIIESDINLGLARSISGGISYVLECFDRVIVLEDDLETSPGFLKYMNDALAVYQDEESVFQVSGFMVKNWPWSAQTGFLRVSTSWGWATWRRAWKHYQPDAETLLKMVEKKGKSKFNLDGYSFHFEELERNLNGQLNTWAVKWYASIFLQDGMCLYPRKSLVRNLGFDGSGTHCYENKTGYFQKMSVAKDIPVKLKPIEESEAYLRAMQIHYRGLLQEWTGTRLRDRVKRKIRKLLAGTSAS